MMYISLTIRSWLFIIFTVPSIFCCIFILYHYLTDRRLRTTLHNHAIILIVFFDLIYELTDITWLIYFYRNGFPLSSTVSFCLTWGYIDYAVYLMAASLIVWTTIERHIIIFNQNWHSTQRKRLFIHYIPMTIICLYPLILYFYIIIILPCATELSYTKSRCGTSACVSRYPLIALWDSVVNNITVIFLIAIFGIALPVRLLYYRRRAQRQVRWRDYRKLVIQLIPILFVYFVISLPPMILYTAYICGVSTDVGADFYSFCMYFSYYSIFLTPFATAVSMPGLKNKWKNMVCFWCRPGPTIVPIVVRTKNLLAGGRATVVPMN